MLITKKEKWLWVQAYLTADDNNTLAVQMNASINNSSNYIGISPNSDQYYTWNNGRNAELTTTLGSNNYQSSAFNWKLNPTGSGFRYGHLNMWIHNEEGLNKRMCYQLTGSSSSTGAGSGQFYQEGWGFLDDLAVEQITRLRFTEATSGVEFDQDSVVTVWGAD